MELPTISKSNSCQVEKAIRYRALHCQDWPARGSAVTFRYLSGIQESAETLTNHGSTASERYTSIPFPKVFDGPCDNGLRRSEAYRTVLQSSQPPSSRKRFKFSSRTKKSTSHVISDRTHGDNQNNDETTEENHQASSRSVVHICFFERARLMDRKRCLSKLRRDIQMNVIILVYGISDTR